MNLPFRFHDYTHIYDRLRSKPRHRSTTDMLYGYGDVLNCRPDFGAELLEGCGPVGVVVGNNDGVQQRTPFAVRPGLFRILDVSIIMGS